MLPEWFSSTYQRYKNDTNFFTSWLTTKAIDSGYRLEKVQTEDHRASSRAKSRKSKDSKPDTVKVTVRQLLEQAIYITNVEPRVLVPKDVIAAARRAVEARGKCSKWYKSAFAGIKNASLDAQNSGHEHFLNSLKFALHTLKPNFAPAEVFTTNSKETLDKLSNRFELLEVEDCIDGLSESPAPKDPEPSTRIAEPKVRHRRGKAVADTGRDWLFKAFCVFEDFNHIRQHLKRVWQKHRDGKMDLVTAALITEVAFVLMEDLECENLFPTVDGEILSPMDVAMLIYEKWTLSLTNRNPLEAGFGFSDEGWNATDWLGVRLAPVVDQWFTGAFPVKDDLRRRFGVYDPAADRSRMTPLERTKKDKLLLALVIPDILLIERFKNFGYHLLVEDNLTRNLKKVELRTAAEYKEQLEPTMSSVWPYLGCQILLDIHHTLQSKVTNPCRQMRIVAQLSKTITQNYGEFLESPSIRALDREPWTAEDTEDLRGLESLLSNVAEDNLTKIKIEYMRATSQPLTTAETVPDAPFSQNPVLCGLTSLGLHLHCAEMGQISADSWWSMMPVAHLYNALQRNGYLCSPWPNMEKLIAYCTPEWMFSGGAPTDLRSCHTKIRLSKGLSATMSASDGGTRNRGIPKVRCLRLFRNRPPSLSTILEKYVVPSDWKQESKGTLLIQSLYELSLAETKVDQSTNEDLGIVKLLHFVERRMASELIGIKLNYYAINEKCTNILLQLRHEFLGAFLMHGFNDHDQESRSLFHVAEDILLLGLMEEAVGTRNRRSGTLARASEIMRNAI